MVGNIVGCFLTFRNSSCSLLRSRHSHSSKLSLKLDHSIIDISGKEKYPFCCFGKMWPLSALIYAPLLSQFAPEMKTVSNTYKVGINFSECFTAIG